MKERGILMSAPMVRACLREVDPKTQTRRIIKDQSIGERFCEMRPEGAYLEWLGTPCCGTGVWDVPEHSGIAKAPYGVPGDRLRVREAWAAAHKFDHLPPRLIPSGSRIHYLADEDKGGLRARPVGLGGGRYLAHRLAWFYMHVVWPSGQIDHINGVRTDNRIENLRDVSLAANHQNLRRPHRDNKVGLLGVRKLGNRFTACIHANGRLIHLGAYRTAEAAHAVYVEAKRKLHGGNTL